MYCKLFPHLSRFRRIKTTLFSFTKSFTLIELLIVIVIVGILATAFIPKITWSQTRAKIVGIQSILRNMQTQAQLYYLEYGSYAWLCNYSSNTVHESFQSLMNSLSSIAWSDNIKCIVRTSSVPSWGAHFVAQDNLEKKNFAVAVYFNDTYYAVDTMWVVIADKPSSSSLTWQNAMSYCQSSNKRLLTIEMLKAMMDTNLLNGVYWSSTSMGDDYAYLVVFSSTINIGRFPVTSPYKAICVS